MATVDDPTATNTYGKRYILANLDQSTISASIRMNYAFTPNVSLQLYLQPLISSGDYDDYKELARSHSYDFNNYRNGIEYDAQSGMVDPDLSGPAAPFFLGSYDFTFSSLRGNAVLRYEFRPGSTFYLVWTQTRQASDDSGTFTFGPQLGELARSDTDNIFLAKVTYYLGF